MSCDANKVLIASNPLDHEGGVVNYYRLFFEHFDDDSVELVHHEFGSRARYYYSPLLKRLIYPFCYVNDFVRFACRLLADRRIRVIQVSPSLIPVPLLRDGLIVLFSRLLGRRVIVFYRGWKDSVARTLRSHRVLRFLFRSVYGKADVNLVLAKRFRNELADLGFPLRSIKVTTTMYDSAAVLPSVDSAGQHTRFLFLGRISELKGIEELIQAAKILKQGAYDFEVTVVGHGTHKRSIEEYAQKARNLGLEDALVFTGRLAGHQKWQAFADSDVFVLPSRTEGCPTSVLEALGSGLFVICTAVGALPEIIREGENGRLVHSKNAIELAKEMAWASDHIVQLRARREEIRNDAFNRFDVRVIIKQFEALYHQCEYQDVTHGS